MDHDLFTRRLFTGYLLDRIPMPTQGHIPYIVRLLSPAVVGIFLAQTIIALANGQIDVSMASACGCALISAVASIVARKLDLNRAYGTYRLMRSSSARNSGVH